MIRILKVLNKNRGTKLEDVVNKELKENDIWDAQIINIQIRGNDEATVVYKSN